MKRIKNVMRKNIKISIKYLYLFKILSRLMSCLQESINNDLEKKGEYKIYLFFLNIKKNIY